MYADSAQVAMAADNSRLYKILITGVGISGKTNISKCLEEDFIKYSLSVTNKDVDWDEDALIVPSDSDVYILQTPKGCLAEKIHKITLTGFDKILYSDPSIQTYAEFLTSRACAWFREGVVEKDLDTNPKPYSNEKLPKIIERIMEYAAMKEKLRNEDFCFFNRPELNFIVKTLEPMIMANGKLFFKNYSKTLEEIMGEIKMT